MRKVLLIALAVMLAIGLTGCTIFVMPGATVHGTVHLEGDVEASNAKITFTPASAAGSSIIVYADANGIWTTDKFEVKPEGYSIKFEHPDAGTPSTISLEVSLPFKTYDVGDVVLWEDNSDELVTVTGLVLEDVTLLPIEGALVTFEYQGTPAYTVSVLTNASGEFEVPGMLAGIYDITISKSGYNALPTIGDEDFSTGGPDFVLDTQYLVPSI